MKLENERLLGQNPNYHGQIGIVGLDWRVSSRTATHHQKMIVIRVGDFNVAFCGGGVDLAYTRRDGPDAGHRPSTGFMAGDWQSGTNLPIGRIGWHSIVTPILL